MPTDSVTFLSSKSFKACVGWKGRDEYISQKWKSNVKDFEEVVIPSLWNVSSKGQENNPFLINAINFYRLNSTIKDWSFYPGVIWPQILV